MHRLALGTVQFGLNYGIANTSGQVEQNEAMRILALAKAAGLDTLDTAIAYGSSETALGRIGVKDWRIVSKLPALPAGCADVAAWVQEQAQASLDRLGVDRLHGLLLHRPDQLFDANGAAYLAALQALKARGLVCKLGVSIYAPQELERLFDLCEFDIVQAPLNILDDRIVASGWVLRLNQAGVELHTRSAFLQGLLLMPAQKRDGKFDRWSGIWQTWSVWLDKSGLSPLQACLAYALSVDGVDKILVGVDSAEQLREILKAASASFPGNQPEWPEPPPEQLVNPALWNQL